MNAKRYIDALCAVSGYTEEDLRGRRRMRPLPALKYILRNELLAAGFSSTEVGREFNISHTSALYAAEAVAIWKANPRMYQSEMYYYNEFKRVLNENVCAGD